MSSEHLYIEVLALALSKCVTVSDVQQTRKAFIESAVLMVTTEHICRLANERIQQIEAKEQTNVD